MKRREFISLLGGAAVVRPLAARAQQSKVARIGVLYIGLADAESFKKELRDGLRELGYVEGQNIAFEFRSAEGKLDRLPELASELVRLNVDLIVALYVPSALAAKQATREIPIVIIAAEPIETGIVASWARPGGNITGVALMSAALVGKCVELFRDMLSATRRIAVLTNAADPLFAKLVVDQVELAGRITGIEIQPIMVRGPDAELDAAFATIARGRANAVVIQGSLSTKRIADLALEFEQGGCWGGAQDAPFDSDPWLLGSDHAAPSRLVTTSNFLFSLCTIIKQARVRHSQGFVSVSALR